MKQLYYIAFLLTLLSCSGHPGEVRIQGRFAHLEQGEFYLYGTTAEGPSRLDTLHIQGGRFSYRLPLGGRAVLHILYPNYSQLILFAQGGDDIKVEGDARNLNAVSVTGTRDNELYTTFRHSQQDASQAGKRQAARDLILQHPTLQVSHYLFEQHFLLSDSARRTDVREIYDSLCRACPDDPTVSHMATAVRAHGLLAKGATLSDFELPLRPPYTHRDAQPDTLRLRSLRGQHLLIAFWAGWRGSSLSALYHQRAALRKARGAKVSLTALSYSLDTDEHALRWDEERDSITFPSYCDFRGFRSLLAERWGIRDLPFYVLVGPDGKVLATGTDWQKHIKATLDKICS